MMYKREYRVISPERGGHHAVIYWITDHTEESVRFLRHLNVRIEKWSTHKHNVLLGSEKATMVLKSLVDPIWPKDLQLLKTDSEDVRNIIVLRDPFNLMASRLPVHGQYIHILHPKEFVKIYKKLAREVLGDTMYLTNLTFVCYNRWVTEENYRRDVGGELNLVGSYHEQYQRVVSTGGGSSFDQREYDGRAGQMKVFDRWKVYRDDYSLKVVARDEELMDLCSQLFGSQYELLISIRDQILR